LVKGGIKKMITLALINKNNIVDNIVVAESIDDFKSHPDYLEHTYVDISDIQASVGYTYNLEDKTFIAPEISVLEKSQAMLEYEKMKKDYEALQKSGGTK
jgi:hypothetical protein